MKGKPRQKKRNVRGRKTPCHAKTGSHTPAMMVDLQGGKEGQSKGRKVKEGK
jgi:hypothetical protein